MASMNLMAERNKAMQNARAWCRKSNWHALYWYGRARQFWPISERQKRDFLRLFNSYQQSKRTAEELQL